MNEYAAPDNSIFLSQRLEFEPAENGVLARGPYQRDRDRIVHSRAFRRLMHKTQVFNANFGDHYRNRLTHSLEVSQISRSIGKPLGLNDELIEAIALGHDLGHTPFGHVGERTIHMIISGQIYIDHFVGLSEGFKHNYQGLQVVDHIESGRSDQYGLNLTLAVREGILKHTDRYMKCNGRQDEIIYQDLDFRNISINKPSMTLEGQLVAICDEIAQCTHDLEDAFRANIINSDDLYEFDLVKKIADERNIDVKNLKITVDVRYLIIREMVNYLIYDVYQETTNAITQYKQTYGLPRFTSQTDVFLEKVVGFTSETSEMIDQLKKQKTDLILSSKVISQSDAKAEYFIKQMFKAYYAHPKQLPDYILKRYCKRTGIDYSRMNLKDEVLRSNPMFVRLICDHIACMTDQYAEREYKRLYLPDYT